MINDVVARATSTSAARTPASGTGARRAADRQSPFAGAGITGRERRPATLSARACWPKAAAGAAPVLGITGTGGAGKSS